MRKKSFSVISKKEESTNQRTRSYEITKDISRVKTKIR